MTNNCTNLVIVGVGGQGIILLSRILGEAALAAELNVMESEIHGMAQRGGVVESAVLLGEVESPTIADGEADIVLGFEPLETLRAIRKCSARTLVISNTSAVLPFTVASGKVCYPEIDEMLGSVAAHVRKLIAFDALALASQAGSDLAVNIVLLGALIRHGRLPVGREEVGEVLSTRTKKAFLQINQKAFALGFEVE